MAKKKPSEAAQMRTKERILKELEAKRKADEEKRQEWERVAKEQAALSLPQAPLLQEIDGVLIDARWCLEDDHRAAGAWRYDASMGRKLCLQCFPGPRGGYPLCPPNPCQVCKTTKWYERPLWLGGLWMCGTCHPGLSPEALERSRPGWASGA